jgi:orotate phosphoribosyltransferase
MFKSTSTEVLLNLLQLNVMNELQQPRCIDLEGAGFNVQKTADETREALLSAGVFIEGNFEFASGIKATLKVDAELLYEKPKQLEIILGHFATFPCVQDADVLLYVPNGMRSFMTMLGEELNKPVAGVIRKPGVTSKYDFVFQSTKDEELALSATSPVIGEDVVTTLGSVAGVRSLLKPEQSVHSLAMLLRGTVDPVYQTGLTDHYLLVRDIPTDKDEFKRQFAKD